MNTKPLSPAAQAVKDHFLANVPINLEHGIAAALRAMEDLLAQNWPEPLLPDHARVVLTERIRLFRQITAIAAELEGVYG